MVEEPIAGFAALPPGVQTWVLTLVGKWTAEVGKKLGVAAWEKGKTTLLGNALHQAFQAGLTDFLADFPARDAADYDVLRRFFEEDTAIAEEAVRLLRLGKEPVDLDRIEASLRAAGLEPETLPDFDLGKALQRFFLAFLNAANEDDELRAKFQTALQFRITQTTPIFFKHDTPAIARYNQHVIDRYSRLTLHSLKADAPPSVELEKVYVQLTAVEQVRYGALQNLLAENEEILTTLSPLEARILRLRFGLISGRGHTLEEIGQKFSRTPEDIRQIVEMALAKVRRELGEGPMKREITVEQVLSVQEALAETPRLVIIGAPGCGKTTLLQWIALTCARDLAQERLGLTEHRVPVFVPLRTLGKYIESRADHFEPTPACLLDYLEDYCARWRLNLPQDLFTRLAKKGQIAFLLDGLDEVADPSRRALVAEAVRALVTRYGGNRYVVTSRPAGYTGLARFGADFRCCDIRPFSDEDVENFVTNWYLAVETEMEDNPATRQKAAENASDLLKRIRDSDRIRRLVDTPLLLSVVALVHQIRTTLPQRRAELYDECTQQLLGFWDEQRRGEAAQELARLGGLDRQAKRAILEPVALKFHERREAQEVEGPQLRRWIQEEFEALGEAQTARRAGTFLRVIQERAGLLVESEPDTYRFSHLTFQEYLAARAVADREDYIAYTLARRPDPWWREVILLEVGHLITPGSKQARRLTTDLVLALWKAEETDPLEQEMEEILCRNLLLAGCCLADLGPIGIDDVVRDGILAELGQVLRTTPYSKLREEAARVLAGLGGSGSAERAAAELGRALADADSLRVRQAAASSLGQLGQASPAVVQALIQALADAGSGVRQAAASSLGQLGQASPAVVQALIQALADAGSGVRQAAASSLGQLGQASPAVVQALIQALADDNSWRVCEAAASSLVQLGQTSPAVVQTLIQVLAGDDISSVRGSAAPSLVQLGQASPAVVQALIQALADADSLNVRLAAASSLVQLGQASPAVVQALIQALADADSWRFRQAAASSLVQLGQASPAVVQALIQALADADWDVRQAAASSLGQLGQASPAVVQALIQALADADRRVRQAAASSLGQLGQASPAVVQALIQALADDELIARQAATSLVQLGQASPAVVQALIQALADADSWRFRQAAASSLVQLGQASPAVVQALIQALADADRRVRQAAASSLGQLGQASPAVVQALIQALADDELIARQAATSLGQLGQTSPAVVQALIQAFADADRRVRQAAASSLGQLGQASPAVVQAFIQALADDEWIARQAVTSLVQLAASDREMVLCALLSTFTDPHFKKLGIFGRPAYDYAFNVLWAIAGAGEAEGG